MYTHLYDYVFFVRAAYCSDIFRALPYISHDTDAAFSRNIHACMQMSCSITCQAPDRIES
jgi:hypothetical protein